ncbi:MAG: beta-lactamase family protein [Anaerolineales bacterium]|nr:beta-lactamase family protein [Anaerolineales bacterium]
MPGYAQLDSALEDIMARWEIPGLGVGIVEQGEIVYARGFGVQSLETGVPVTPDTLFCVASIAKCFVACAIMQLVEQGKLQLDAPVVKYLPDFQLDGDHHREITLRQMLSHTSGMPDMDETEYDELVAHPEYDEETATRYVRALSTRKMIALPGERFAYSNIAYNLLGHLIAQVTGMTFEDYMQTQILTPAGMPESTFFFPEVPRGRLAVPHLRTPEMTVNPSYPYHRADAPASFLYTSVKEMCHWALTNLNRGCYAGNRLLIPASYDLMWTPVARRNYPPFREEMGLGWALGHFEGVRTVAHGGGGFGWTCHLILLPEKNCATIILCNEESSAIERLEQAVVRTLLGLKPLTGPVSWMIPVSRALHTGGIGAAHACYEEILNHRDYFFDAYDLITLGFQLMSVKKFKMARQVLELNLHAFPDDQGTMSMLAKLSDPKA